MYRVNIAMFFAKFLLVLFVSIASSKTFATNHNPYKHSFCKPEQIHIAYGESANSITITWSTRNATKETLVQYGTRDTGHTARGWSEHFTDGTGQWIHRVTLHGLLFDTKYVYRCGSHRGWSRRYWFRTPPPEGDWPVRAAIYGDMGVDNARSLPYLREEVARDKFDVIIHLGDFAYDMYEKQSRVGDQFMRQIQPLAAILPYMTCPGNHEEHRNFSNYRHRFSMPNYNSTESLFYSWDLGPVHFVALDTEAYYFLQYGVATLVRQYGWLETDLADAAEPKNRARRPWIVMYGHRPMYCSNSDDIDCSIEYTREGLLGMLGLEPLLWRYGVDLALWAHEHSYERSWPLYDGRVYNGSMEHPYVNPRAPVHIVTGSAGCREGRDHFTDNPQSWSAFRAQDFGYTRLKAYNRTHINIEQVSVDLDGQVIDSIWLVKDKAVSFTML